METFLQGHDPQNGWNQTSQDELEALIQESVAEDKTEDLKLVVFASRTPAWREPLRSPQILLSICDQWMLPKESNDEVAIERASIAIRLAANCCIEHPPTQSHMTVSSSLDRIQRCLEQKALFGLTVGLLSNLYTQEEYPVASFEPLFERRVHTTITAKIRDEWLRLSDQLFKVASQFLEFLSGEDISCSIPDPSASSEALKSLLNWTLDRSDASLPIEEVEESVLEAVVNWSSSNKIIKMLNESSVVDLAHIYKQIVIRLADQEDENLLLPRLQNALGDIADQIEIQELGNNTLFVEMQTWIQLTDASPSKLHLAATGFLVIGNLVQTDILSRAAVHEFDLHTQTCGVLERLPINESTTETRYLAAAFLANLAILKENKDSFVSTNIVPKLFDKKMFGEKNALPIHVLRKLVGNDATTYSKLLVQPDPREHGVLAIGDLESQLPNQMLVFSLYQDKKLPAGATSHRQLTVDIGRIIARVLRSVHRSTEKEELPEINSEFMRPQLVYCLVNLIRLGYEMGQFQDASEGLFGLALAITQDGVAYDAVEAFSWDGYKPLKLAMEAGAKVGQHEKARQDAENAMFVLAKLQSLGGVHEGIVSELLKAGSGARSLEAIEEGSEEAEEDVEGEAEIMRLPIR